MIHPPRGRRNTPTPTLILRARPHLLTPRRDVVLVSAALAVIAVGLGLTLPDAGQPTLTSPWWSLVVIAGAFALTEFTVFRFLFRRESIAFSLSEIPLAFCLVCLAPGPAFLARAVGTSADHPFIRRPPRYKMVFNVGAIAFELLLGLCGLPWVPRRSGATATPSS